MPRTQKQRDYQKGWWKKNPQKLKAKKASYYQRHREEILEKRKKYYAKVKADPVALDRLRAVKRSSVRRRSEQKREEQASRKKSEMCESCGEIGYVVYDHDHITGEFRGWLCQACNKALGFLRDNPAYIRALEGYVIKDFLRKQYKKLGIEVEFSDVLNRVRGRMNLINSRASLHFSDKSSH